MTIDPRWLPDEGCDTFEAYPVHRSPGDAPMTDSPRYPPCCDSPHLAELGGTIVECLSCGQVLPPYAPVDGLIADLEAAPAELTEAQRLRMIGELDQLAADMDAWRNTRR